ncbi:MAG: hypothetical protein RBQ99_00475 [Trichlorobacter sp.]|nr:hypothetical protein [Trichlorobacter sp.]
MNIQHCAICAWRETCAKRFCVTDSGRRCPDFSRDVTIKISSDESVFAPDPNSNKE